MIHASTLKNRESAQGSARSALKTADYRKSGQERLRSFKLMPALTIEEDELQCGLEIIENAMRRYLRHSL
jgi:4-aminobutyrate aminotransferase-like enzyme